MVKSKTLDLSSLLRSEETRAGQLLRARGSAVFAATEQHCGLSLSLGLYAQPEAGQIEGLAGQLHPQVVEC